MTSEEGVTAFPELGEEAAYGPVDKVFGRSLGVRVCSGMTCSKHSQVLSHSHPW